MKLVILWRQSMCIPSGLIFFSWSCVWLSHDFSPHFHRGGTSWEQMHYNPYLSFFPCFHFKVWTSGWVFAIIKHLHFYDLICIFHQWEHILIQESTQILQVTLSSRWWFESFDWVIVMTQVGAASCLIWNMVVWIMTLQAVERGHHLKYLFLEDGQWPGGLSLAIGEVHSAHLLYIIAFFLPLSWEFPVPSPLASQAQYLSHFSFQLPAK